MSTYSNLKVELIGTGQQQGTWGDTTNLNLGTALEEAIVGMATADFTSDADLPLTLADTPATQIARHFVLDCISSFGSLTTTRDLIVPAIEKPYIVRNNTTGGQSVRVKTSATAATALVNGTITSNVNLIVDNNAGTIFKGMVVTGTGIVGDVTVAQVLNQNSLVLSSAQSLSDNTSLTFSPATVTVLNGKHVFVYNDVANIRIAFDQVGALSVTGDGTFTGTGQVKLPAGTTAQRSGSPVEGMLRYNTDLDSFEGYDGDWGSIGGAQAGGAILVNKSAASVSYVIEVGENGLSVGPITVNSGVTVTVSSGQRWLVL